MNTEQKTKTMTGGEIRLTLWGTYGGFNAESSALFAAGKLSQCGFVVQIKDVDPETEGGGYKHHIGIFIGRSDGQS